MSRKQTGDRHRRAAAVPDVEREPVRWSWEVCFRHPADGPAGVTDSDQTAAAGLPATGLPATGLPATGLPATGLPTTGTDGGHVVAQTGRFRRWSL